MSAVATTWQPLAESYDQNDNGKLDNRERRGLPDSAFAFPAERQLPLVDADHVRLAVARFDEVIAVTADGRDRARANIRLAAEHFGVPVTRE